MNISIYLKKKKKFLIGLYKVLYEKKKNKKGFSSCFVVVHSTSYCTFVFCHTRHESLEAEPHNDGHFEGRDCLLARNNRRDLYHHRTTFNLILYIRFGNSMYIIQFFYFFSKSIIDFKISNELYYLSIVSQMETNFALTC